MGQRLGALQSKTTRERTDVPLITPFLRRGGKLEKKMVSTFVLVVLLMGLVSGDDSGVVDYADEVADTDLLQAFVMFRHGDRTPDEEEIETYPDAGKHINDAIFFPYGKKALTNKGKQRAYLVGKYLRDQYDDLVSRLYLPDEVTVQTTAFARTKMTALVALSALYPPPPAQMWNTELDWQPIPYNTPPEAEDPLLYWYNCPRYLHLRDKSYDEPEFKKKLESYQGLLKFLTEKTGKNISTSSDVFYLDNLFQTLKNVGIDPPQWAQQVMPQIKAVTKLEYATESSTRELIRLSTGPLMQFILNTTRSSISNTTNIEPKLFLFSAHENNVAALMAAAGVFEPHQPNYGATFALELRRNINTQEYGISAVYAKDAGGPPQRLAVSGCGGSLVCNYDKFVQLTQDIVISESNLYQVCKDVTSY